MAIHFISDLHLADDTPVLNTLFTDTLAAWRGNIDALYILGDLFEVWVGDDDSSPFIDAMLSAMRDFAAVTPLYVMRGNRDFLLGNGFAAATGAQLLADPTCIEAFGQRVLLAHGDAMCTDDLPYQQFRAMARNPQWQAGILAKSLAERHVIAQQIRAMSETGKQENGLTAISDVTETAVQATLAEQAQGELPPLMIHGHTHRPARHDVTVNGHTTQRWVIADWHDGKGGYLRLDAAGVSAHPLG
ncbi:UDP-2,3-diacylglucosamine diphosphatase [Neisseriaceae bacterium JH1-16]|nr:UDP-2,3-diacylglucosamine diphosphatase [Neisseriaceae bacterium JH1-16]